MREVSAERVQLLPQIAAHAGEMFVLLSDPALYEHENEPPRSLEWLTERFGKLESRRSADGSELWLNWVVQLQSAGLIGFVQASVRPDGCAAIAYVFGSMHWGRGLASESVRAMIDELVARHGVTSLSAVLKRDNERSLRLLVRLGFRPATDNERTAHGVERDELLLLRAAVCAPC